MLMLKTNPVGIDIPIQNAQKQLHKQLVRALELEEDTQDIHVFGRAYRNQQDNGYVAETYMGNNEYKEVYWDDSLSLISFFGIGQEIKAGVMNQADVHLVVFADLKKLELKDREKNIIQHRSDEELRQIFHKALRSSYGLTYSSLELGIENVLSEYPGSKRDQRLKFVDMHPIHCFRFNYTLNYDPNKIC